MSDKKLMDAAIEVSARAYARYSNFKVGAALLCEDGTLVTGVNVENVSFGLTNCAERSALFTAVSMGKTQFKAMAIYSPNASDYLMPCGACRQALSEFVGPDFPMYLGKADGSILETPFKELFPSPFTEKIGK